MSTQGLFDKQAALQAGYSQQEIDSYLAGRSGGQQQQKPSLLGKIGGFATKHIVPKTTQWVKDVAHDKPSAPRLGSTRALMEPDARSLKGFGRFAKESFKEQMPVGREIAPYIAPWTLPKVAGASALGRVAQAGKRGAVLAGSFAAMDPADSVGQWAGNVAGRSALGAGLSAGIQGLAVEPLRALFGAAHAPADIAAAKGQAATDTAQHAAQAKGQVAADAAQQVAPDTPPQVDPTSDIDPLEQIFPRSEHYTPTAGEKMYMTKFNVSSKFQQRALDPIGTTRSLIKHNIDGSLDDIAYKSDAAVQHVDKMLRNVVGPGEVVDTSNALTEASKAWQMQQGSGVTQADQRMIFNNISTIVGKYSHGSQPYQVHPADALAAAREVDRLAAKVSGSQAAFKPSDPRLEGIADVYYTFSRSLERLIDKSVQKANVDAVKTPENLAIADMISTSGELKKEILAAQTVRDFRSMMKPFVRAKIMVQATNDSRASDFYKAFGSQLGAMERFDLTKPGTWVAPLTQSEKFATKGGTMLSHLADAKEGPTGQAVSRYLSSPALQGTRDLIGLLSSRVGAGREPTPPIQPQGSQTPIDYAIPQGGL